MQIEYGAEVIDKNGKVLGTVDYIVHNSWTGELSKFMVRQKVLEKDLFLSPEDVVETTKTRIRLSVSSEELNQESKR
jgi:sporulation protein YlmC with PRC-barrel domain